MIRVFAKRYGNPIINDFFIDGQKVQPARSQPGNLRLLFINKIKGLIRFERRYP